MMAPCAAAQLSRAASQPSLPGAQESRGADLASPPTVLDSTESTDFSASETAAETISPAVDR